LLRASLDVLDPAPGARPCEREADLPVGLQGDGEVTFAHAALLAASTAAMKFSSRRATVVKV
jgi:hypothetical protein